MRRLYKIKHGYKTGVGCKDSDAFYKNSGHFNQNSWAFDAISRPFDTISGAFFWILCAVCIKSNTFMNTGVGCKDSDAFYKNSGHFHQNYCALMRFLVRLIGIPVHFFGYYAPFV